MATKKFYVVKKGRKTGIFSSWDECKQQVAGYSDAVYKSFPSLEDAKKYLDGNDSESDKSKNEIVSSQEVIKEKVDNSTDNYNTIIAYVDGSYSETERKYSFGCVLLADEVKVTELSGVGDNQDAVGMRNVAGELLGAMRAIKWANDNKYEKIIIYHDYEGIAKWANGAWKAKHESTKKYIDFIKKYNPLLKIEFVKVLAHSGIKYNEEADRLAKKALENIVNSSYDEPKNEIDKDLKIFSKIMNSKEKTKNKFSVKFKDYEISENKLQKYAKELWKYAGKEESLIDSINMQVNPYDCYIRWEIKDKKGDLHKFRLSIK